MVNYNDPAVLRADGSAEFGLWHAVAGLYFWEYVSTLDYEWSIIRGHRPFRWTIWIYSTMRISTLIAVILTLVKLNVGGGYNCEAAIVSLFFFGYLALACASLLIVLRILAIWNKKIITAIAGGAWGINVIFQIQAIVRMRAQWVPRHYCVVTNLHISELNILVQLATDTTLLLIMFFGLLRLGCYERGVFGLGRLLWKQVGYWYFSLAVVLFVYMVVHIYKGLIWFLVATIAGVPITVFLCLNLNPVLNSMFFPPSMVTLTIAATRIYRFLAEHASSGCANHCILSASDSRERSGRIEWSANRPPIALTRVELTVNRTTDQDLTQQTSRNDSIEEQLCEKPGKQRGLDESPENNVECQRQAPS